MLNRPVVPVIFILLLCALTRLPQLLDPSILLDGDESIMGLMAKHFYTGENLPIFFYGQKYGFSIFEVLPIGGLFALFGVGDVAVKVAMLLIWTGGILFFYVALLKLAPSQKKLAFLMTLVFIFAPSWAIWSMKARGGYLTSFLLSAWSINLMVDDNRSNKKDTSLLLGVHIAFVSQAQPLWLPGLLPLLIYHVLRHKWNVLWMAQSIIPIGIAFVFIEMGRNDFWSPEVASTGYFQWQNVLNIPSQVFHYYTGSFAYNNYFAPAWTIQFWSILVTALTFVFMLLGLRWPLVRKGGDKPFFFLFSLSVLFTLSYVPFTEGKALRYLLPLIGYTLLMLFAGIHQWKNKMIPNLSLILLCVMGITAFYQPSPLKATKGDRKALDKLLTRLEDRGIEYLFCKHGLLQWQIMFYTNEGITCRYLGVTDRYPKYVIDVNEAFNDKTGKIGMVGEVDQILDDERYVEIVNDRYFFMESPSRKILEKNSFVIPYNN